ncbi:MAG: hypothetical protein E7233_13765 [Lachnospiraceae bacterium]|nr:hypothetical protein [Lachnospiraceae bacterium]
MSLIICAKDIGLTEVCSMGTIDAISHGCVTAAAVFLNMPGTEYALQKLSETPWVSLIWQVSDTGRNPLQSGQEELLEYEVLNCIRIYGKAPCAALIESDTLAKPARKICEKYGIAHDWLGKDIIPVAQSSVGLGFDNFPQYDPEEQFFSFDSSNGIYFISTHPGFLDDISMAATLDTDYSVHRLADQRLLCSDDFRKKLLSRHELISPDDAL